METKNTRHSYEGRNPAEIGACHKTRLPEAEYPHSRGWQKRIAGFTLVELLVVITILVILWIIAFLNLGGFSSSARDSRRVSDMANIGKAIDLTVAIQGNAPIPANPVSYTGGVITIQMGTVTNTTIPKMSGDFTDPVTKTSYNYSVFGNGSYYQIGIDFENPLSLSSPWQGGFRGFWVETAHADSVAVKYSKLSGNYRFDPSLPSLFFLTGTYNTASGGIFSPDVCFVMNNLSTNTFSSTSTGCVVKKNMSLKDIDSGLVGYWDMETLSGTLLKDLSGNGNNGVFSGGMSYGNALTGGIAGKAMVLNGSWDMISITGSDLSSFNNIFSDKISISFDYVYSWSGGRPFNCIVSKWDGISSGFELDILNTTGSPFFFTSTTSKPNSSKVVLFNDRVNIGDRINYTWVYDGAFAKIFKNWILQRTDTYSWTITLTWNLLLIGRDARNEWVFYSSGIIDEVKIYNRALSDEEVKQQAKIAGF